MEPSQLDSVVRMAEAIDQFGALAMGLAAFMCIAIVAVFFIFSSSKKLADGKDSNFQRMFAAQAEQQQVFSQQQQQVFAELMKSAFNAAKSGSAAEPVLESIMTAGAIKEQLKTVAAITKADRISVYSFKNAMFSCWAEYVMLSSFVRIDKHKDIQISHMQGVANMLLSNPRWEGLTEMDVKAQLCDFNIDLNVKSAFAQSIYSADGIFIGFVLLEYILNAVEPTWVERAREEAKKLSDKVSLVMDIDLHEEIERRRL